MIGNVKKKNLINKTRTTATDLRRRRRTLYTCERHIIANIMCLPLIRVQCTYKSLDIRYALCVD